MTAQPQHLQPVGKQDTLDTWRQGMRMPAPTRPGDILEVKILALYETTRVNGLPLDALVEAQATVESNPVRFGVIFSSSPPDWDAYPIPVLWIDVELVGVGRWRIAARGRPLPVVFQGDRGEVRISANVTARSGHRDRFAHRCSLAGVFLH